MFKQQEVRAFSIQLGVLFSLQLPKDADILKIIKRDRINEMYIVADFNTAELETRHFVCYRSNDQICTDMNIERIYIDSFVDSNKTVYHLFEEF